MEILWEWMEGGVILPYLRRTATSLMASEEVPRFTTLKILNHVKTGMIAVYDQHSYDAEKSEAMDKWTEYEYDLNN